MNKYDVGTKMRKHYDHIHSVFKDRKGIPVLSIVGLLNDNFEGGETIVENFVVKPKQGKILIFSNGIMYHEVKKIKKNNRFMLSAWYK